jgi:glycine cleavage system H protein
MNVPADLKYTASHEWVRAEPDGSVTIGITDYAQEALGDVVFVELPEQGRKVAAEEACAVVESVKAASDIYAPVSGEVVAINDGIPGHWEAINKDAFAAWLYKLKPSRPEELKALLDAAKYAATAEAPK